MDLIPTTERLPEVGKKIQVYTEPHNDLYYGYFNGDYQGGQAWTVIGSTAPTRVTHWAPLPELPKKKR